MKEMIYVPSPNYAVGNIGNDLTFELNEFNEPRIRSEIETIKNVVLFILFSKPGQYPSLPYIGLDINHLLYSHYDEINVDNLVAQITEQCSALGAYISNGSIAIRKLIYRKQPSLIIHISGRETYPSSYKHDYISNTEQYMIGITYDELKNMIYNVNRG